MILGLEITILVRNYFSFFLYKIPKYKISQNKNVAAHIFSKENYPTFR